MISRIHQKLGTAGFVISIVALVAAMGGGAYAASGGLNGKQKKEVEKIAKKYAGKPGAAGATGPAGPAGAKGDAGAAGAQGPQGPAGAQGAQGSEGKPGKEGSPWTAGGTLPSGKTETGVWNLALQKEQSQQVPISFILPVSGTVEPVFVAAEGEHEEACPGISGGEPTASPGKACFYQFELSNGELETPIFFKPFGATPGFPEFGAGPSGTFLVAECISTSAPCVRLGTWAVTAE